MIELLDRQCEIWQVQEADPEVENSQDTEVVAFPSVACRKDSIMNRASNSETPSAGGVLTTAKATFFLADPRLNYPVNFDEQMWIVQEGIRYNILAIHEADDLTGLHHYEVDTVAGRRR